MPNNPPAPIQDKEKTIFSCSEPEMKENSIFDLFEVPTEPGNVGLRSLVRHFLGGKSVRNIPGSQMLMILGRLRFVQAMIQRYNKGVHEQNPVFLQYFQFKTLNYLSAFGHKVQKDSPEILVDGLEELISKIEEVFQSEITEAHQLISNGAIVFSALGELYKPFHSIQGSVGLAGTPGIFMVTETYFEEHRSLLGTEKSFHMTLEFIATMGEHFTLGSFTEVISSWTGVGTRQISDLNFYPVPESDYPILNERGRKYSDFAIGAAKFLAYRPGSFFLHSYPSKPGSTLFGKGSSQLSTSGRIMVDPMRGAELGHHASQGVDESTHTLIELSVRYRRWKANQLSGSKSSTDTMILWTSIPDELKIYTWPALVGFSFSAKAWGHVLVSGLESISFHENAFDLLVLAEERKNLIRALVKFGGDLNTDDIVGGKRGGSIFLLHGPPGVGKTLTAEAIAEVLHRPLYYVTMGELGMTPDDMERRLGDVLELCAGWNAIALLDEADVFLETRSTSDLTRNAMVCVMLRLLEYHPGILFLTTNRVKSFDPAFESRVTVALRYESLNAKARELVWRNLVTKVSIEVADDIVYSELSEYALNGRQIKNSVRLGVALACETKSPLNMNILRTTLRVTNLGREEMKSDDSWKDK